MNVQPGSRNKGRVLVVEDDGLVADMIAITLVRWGYEVVGIARDGPEALDAVTRLRPDVVVMDLVMPEMGGIETARRIQQIFPTPVIVVTAYEIPQRTEIPAESGVVACLSKPPQGLDLDRAIADARAGIENPQASPGE